MIPFPSSIEPFRSVRNGYLSQNPDLIIRERGFGSRLPNQTPIDFVRKVEGLHTELERDFGIEVVRHAVVLGESESLSGEESIWFVAEKLDGKTHGLADVDTEITAEQKLIYSGLADRLFDYLRFKSISGEPFLGDIYGAQQYILRSCDQTPVLVDLEAAIAPRRQNVDTFERANYEFLQLEFLLGECHALIQGTDDSANTQRWYRMASECLDIMSIENGVVLPNRTKRDLLDMYAEGMFEDFEPTIRALLEEQL